MRIGILCLAIALTTTAIFSCGAGVGPASPNASRAATFVGLNGLDTLFVERVRDVPGGFHGEVSLPGGAIWVRYRVQLGPDETIRRYELDMTSMVEAKPGDIPRPLLVARREPDSILIEPEPGMSFPGRRVAVSPAAFLASTEMGVIEQAIRYGLRGGSRGEFPMVSAWTGHSMDAMVRRNGNRVRLETGRDAWEFTLDRRRRMVAGTLLSGGLGIRVVRLDPSRSHSLHQPLSIGESGEGRRRDRLDSLSRVWRSREAEFRATLATAQAASDLAVALDRHLVAFADRGGAYRAERCLEAVAVLRGRSDGIALAERYARRAVAFADSHNVAWFGDQGMVEARMTSRMALAGILAGLGRRDSAILVLEAARALAPELEHVQLRRDVHIQLGDALAAQGRRDEAIVAWFEAVALDTTSLPRLAEPLRRSLSDHWSRAFPGDTTLATRIVRARTFKWPGVMMSAGMRELKGAVAPSWSGLDLRGQRHASRAGRPLALVFWGGWSDVSLRMVQLAETWHRRRAETGVDVVSFDWELPGRGPFSERMARHAAGREHLTLPVVLDHDRETWTRFGCEGFPQVVFVDRRGRMVRTVSGGIWSPETLSVWVEALGRDELR